MSTLQTHALQDDCVFRLTVEQYHTMIKAGVFAHDDKVELVEGMLVRRMSKNPPHVYATRRVGKLIERMLPTGYFLSRQDPITLSDGEPEPDLMVVAGSEDDYAQRHPIPTEVPLVIESSDSSLRIDRKAKLRSYARAAIAAYWIVNVNARCIEVYGDPVSGAEVPSYRSQHVYTADAKVPVVIAGQTVGEIAVADVLP
jgi:Uma2 family endonuclease